MHDTHSISPRLTIAPKRLTYASLFLLFLGLLPISLWLLTKELPTWAVVPVWLAVAIHSGVSYWRARLPRESLNVFWYFVAAACALIPYGAQFGFSVAHVLITDAALRRVFTLG